jgi:hypothetical protein
MQLQLQLQLLGQMLRRSKGSTPYEPAPVSLCFSGLKPPEGTLNFLNSRDFVSKFKA